MKRRFSAFGIALLFLMVVYCQRPELLTAQSAMFQVATQGCPMAHCDNAMSAYDPLTAPVSTSPILLAHDPLPVGSNSGLGCASNGSVVVCSYTGSTGDNIVAYSN